MSVASDEVRLIAPEFQEYRLTGAVFASPPADADVPDRYRCRSLYSERTGDGDSDPAALFGTLAESGLLLWADEGFREPPEPPRSTDVVLTGGDDGDGPDGEGPATSIMTELASRLVIA